MHLKSNRFSLSTYLVVIVIFALLPALLFSGTVIERLVRAKQEAGERLLMKAADELALAVDQEMVATVRTLEAITNANSLQTGDLKTFQRTLEKVLQSQPSWSNVLLHDRHGRWLISARLPFGTPLPIPPEPESIFDVVRTGKPAIGRVIKVPPFKDTTINHGFAVRVPVKDRAGQVSYVLSAILSTETMQNLVARFSLAPGEIVRGVVDTQFTLAARSLNPDKFVGRSASPTLVAHLKEGRESGLDQTVTLDNVRAYSAYRRAPYSGWISAIAVPAAVLEAEAKATLNSIILIGLAIVGLSALVVSLLSRSLKKSIVSASGGAAALARGERPAIPDSQIREIQQLRQSLLSASELLQSRDQAKTDFLANMSHELRTPLGIVLGMTELFAQGKIPPEERLKSWEIVNRNGRQLAGLIDDILDLSKIEAQRLETENLELSLPEIIYSVTEDLSARALAKGVRLKVILEQGSPRMIHSDPVRLRQIILNIIGNAVKFTEKGEIEIRVHPAENQKARITIRDTGIGLSEEQQNRLFGDFNQADNSHTRKYGGTGLGLSLSRKLARLLGGDVRLISTQPGEGSVFEILIRV